jgi:hypothetical protein
LLKELEARGSNGSHALFCRSHAFLYLCMPACVSIRQHTPTAYVNIRQHTSANASIRQHASASVNIRQHTSAYASIRQHTPAYASIREHVLYRLGSTLEELSYASREVAELVLLYRLDSRACQLTPREIADIP